MSKLPVISNKDLIKTFDKEIYLNNLLSNAFDFLERSINQFEKEPKYSVINFCSAVELILKSRLLKEHWSLVVAKEPVLNSFIDGSFKSVGFANIIPKIKSVLNENISKDMEKCFEGLANHRNKMVHFYHQITTHNASSENITEIVVEQYNAWIHLQKLFKMWDFIYAPYNQKIAALDLVIKNQDRQKYFQAKFDGLKEEIEKRKKDGAIFINCTSCSFPAMLEKQECGKIYHYSCCVCDKKANALKIECPDCKNEVLITEDNVDSIKIECEACGNEITKDILFDVIDTNPTAPDEYNSVFPINCTYCGEYGCVVQHNDLFVCLNCLEHKDNVHCCEWCNEGVLGGNSLEYSYEEGCEFCDGHSGWHNHYENI